MGMILFWVFGYKMVYSVHMAIRRLFFLSFLFFLGDQLLSMLPRALKVDYISSEPTAVNVR